MNLDGQKAMKSYTAVAAHSQVAAADPYRLVQLMYENVIDRLAAARGHMERREIARKGEQISRSIAIINALDSSLNFEQGGEIAVNLHSLYEYMLLRLVKANAENDSAGLDEVAALVRDIKQGWDGIRTEARATPAQAAR